MADVDGIGRFRRGRCGPEDRRVVGAANPLPEGGVILHVEKQGAGELGESVAQFNAICAGGTAHSEVSLADFQIPAGRERRKPGKATLLLTGVAHQIGGNDGKHFRRDLEFRAQRILHPMAVERTGERIEDAFIHQVVEGLRGIEE